MRRGQNERIKNNRTGKYAHTIENVYTEMLLQIAMDYSGLPDVRTLSMRQIRFFYEARRAELLKSTKQK